MFAVTWKGVNRKAWWGRHLSRLGRAGVTALGASAIAVVTALAFSILVHTANLDATAGNFTITRNAGPLVEMGTCSVALAGEVTTITWTGFFPDDVCRVAYNFTAAANNSVDGYLNIATVVSSPTIQVVDHLCGAGLPPGSNTSTFDGISALELIAQSAGWSSGSSYSVGVTFDAATTPYNCATE